MVTKVFPLSLHSFLPLTFHGHSSIFKGGVSHGSSRRVLCGVCGFVWTADHERVHHPSLSGRRALCAYTPVLAVSHSPNVLTSICTLRLST